MHIKFIERDVHVHLVCADVIMEYTDFGGREWQLTYRFMQQVYENII